MRGLVHDLGEVPESSFAEVLQTIRAVVYEQPHKIGYLAFVIAAAPSPVSFMVLEMAHDETSKALQAADLPRMKLFFRFLCALHPVIANTDVLTSFLSSLVLAQPSDPRVKTELYKAALLASLYLPPHLISAEVRDHFLKAELSDAADDTFDYFIGDAKPYETRYLSSLLPKAVEKLSRIDWKLTILAGNPLKPSIDENSPQTESSTDVDVLACGRNNVDKDALEDEYEPQHTSEPSAEPGAKDESVPNARNGNSNGASHPEMPKAEKAQVEVTQHTLRPLHIPDPLIFRGRFSPAYFRCYHPLDDQHETVPAEDTIEGILLRDIATDVMLHMDFNRREVTRQLIALDVFFSRTAFAPPGAWLDQIVAGAQEDPPKPTWKVEDIALEAVFSQMFDLENQSGLPSVYYHSLLIEACVMAPQDIAPVLGRGIRYLFGNLESIDVELFFRVIDWFSHHVSNFAFTWKWNEWLYALSLPEDHPKLVFIKELLSKEIRLSYPQRVRDILPEEFQPLVAKYPDVPPFKYSDNENASKLVESLRSGDVERAKDALQACSDSPNEQIDYLVHAVCHLGNRSITHAASWITKSEALLETVIHAGDNDSAKALLDAVYEHWVGAQWIGSLVVDQFIKANHLKVEFLVKYVIKNQSLLLSSLGWEIIKNNISEAQKMLADAELHGSFADWWRTRLSKAISRIAIREKQKAQEPPVRTSADTAAEASSAETQDSAGNLNLRDLTSENLPESHSQIKEFAEDDGRSAENEIELYSDRGASEAKRQKNA